MGILASEGPGLHSPRLRPILAVINSFGLAFPLRLCRQLPPRVPSWTRGRSTCGSRFAGATKGRSVECPGGTERSPQSHGETTKKGQQRPRRPDVENTKMEQLTGNPKLWVQCGTRLAFVWTAIPKPPAVDRLCDTAKAKRFPSPENRLLCQAAQARIGSSRVPLPTCPPRGLWLLVSAHVSDDPEAADQELPEARSSQQHETRHEGACRPRTPGGRTPRTAFVAAAVDHPGHCYAT